MVSGERTFQPPTLRADGSQPTRRRNDRIAPGQRTSKLVVGLHIPSVEQDWLSRSEAPSDGAVYLSLHGALGLEDIHEALVQSIAELAVDPHLCDQSDKIIILGRRNDTVAVI
jgi:hypothetical protein